MRYQLHMDARREGNFCLRAVAPSIRSLDEFGFGQGDNIKVWDSLRLRWISAAEYRDIIEKVAART